MRTLTEPEYKFLDRISCESGVDLHVLGACRQMMVSDMPDGGMGSISFGTAQSVGEPRKFGRIAIEGQFNDADGMPVSFAVYLDKAGALFELDMWRVDFNPLQSFPKEDDVISIRVRPSVVQ